jgi:Leucine-rich repeat (LRR) protein
MIRRDSFLGLEQKLEILAFANSNLKHLGFIQNLANLKVLKLNDNNINQLSIETFENLAKLEVIDFSSNHIGNWYAQAFQFNSNLRVLNLRDNNINLLTADMMTDFSIVDYLAIGNNNFICNCMLREFIELAAKNTRLANCSYGEESPTPPTATQLPVPLSDFIDHEQALINPNFYVYDHGNKYDIVTRIFHQYQESVTASTLKIKESSDKYGMHWNLILYNKNKLQSNDSGKSYDQTYSLTNHDSSIYCNETHFSREHHFSTSNNSVEIRLNFTFRLLDYNENDYVCIDSENNTEHYFVELNYCGADRMTIPNFIERFQANSIGLGTLLLVMVIFAFILLVYYHKWWDIRYIFLLVKNATILSQLNKEQKKMKNDDVIVEAINSNYNYDVFVSYSEPNRHWILTEFLPNIESGNDVNVCLHERDFQVIILCS